MYFSYIPDVKYDIKPISYPFSEADFTTTKNFFRRFKINDDIFGYATFYDKYSVEEGVKLETIASNYYGSPFYDWIIVLTNNFINPQFGFPQNTETVRKIAEHKYGEIDAFSGIHHYETIETKSEETVDGLPIVVLEGGLKVDKNFYDSPFTYWDGTQHITVAGNIVSKAILNYEHEVAENEKKREIYILKQAFFFRFVEEFKKQNLYGKSSDFINKRLKKTGV
tara:strand:+ start:2965 stop:3636 length:672 start_codon:yes stop_codon:yes gene_type:complete